jgi:hypothetical protein
LQPGTYVVPVRRRKYLLLTELEEAEFEKAMFGHDEALATDDFKQDVIDAIFCEDSEFRQFFMIIAIALLLRCARVFQFVHGQPTICHAR